MRRHRWSVGAVIALALLTASCGSTITSTGGTQSALDDATGGTGPAAQPALTGPGAVGGAGDALTPGDGAGGVGGEAVGSGGPGQAGGARGTTGSGGRTGAALTGRGFDAKKILLGYTTSRDFNAFANGLGLDVSAGDTDAQVQAIARDINARGGILGRRVELLVHDFSTANYARDEAGETQKACATFTEDNKPFAVLNTIGLGNASLAACLKKVDIPYIDNRFSRSRDPVYGDYRRILYKPSSMNVDTYVPLFVNGLLRQKYFSGWDTLNGAPGKAPVKVGMLHFDAPDWNYYMNAIKKRLAAAGYPVAMEVTYPVGVDNVVAASSSAVLQFREAGITHVINTNIAFVQAAENQNYRPRYSMDTGFAPQAFTGVAPRRQLQGSMGAGYNPFSDVLVSSDPQNTRRPAQVACERLMRNAGEDTSNQAALQLMMAACDLFNFLSRSLNNAGSISTDAVAVGANAIGASFQSTITFQVQFDVRHHAGAVAARNFAYFDDCTCYKYTSPPFKG